MLTKEPISEEESMNGEFSRELPFAASADTWYDANQHYLAVALSDLRAHVETKLLGRDGTEGEGSRTPGEDDVIDRREWTFSQPPALDQLCSAFELSVFERSMLLLAAGAEMDSRLAELYVAFDVSRHGLPTLKLALTTLPEAHWSVLSPSRALRRWQLIDLLPADTLIGSPFRLNERILHFLAGVADFDERLHPILRRIAEPGLLSPSCTQLAMQAASVWSEAAIAPDESSTATQLPLIELCGSDPETNRTVAASMAAMLNLCLYVLSPRGLPQNTATESDLLIRLLEREAALSRIAVLIESEDMLGLDANSPLLSLLVESLHIPLILSARQPLPSLSRPRAVFHTHRPTRAEQAELWRTSLQDASPEVIDVLIAQFDLAPVSIRSAVHRAVGALHRRVASDPGELTTALWDACRTEARPRLEGLAQRIEPVATWQDLVLPAREREQLRHIVLHVRHRTRVYEGWGFVECSSRGLGISALFAGPSGTGKTTAAEVLANELRLDLFRIDLSQVISKYIGETEKNLSRVFDAAEQGAAVLLFDEADALFGKRTEVKDSHDRYANIEVSYLLQRMESYRGVAILTTNRKSSLDHAFLRRIRFVVEFPFPEAPQRAEIWRRVFPRRTPVQGLNIDRLARLRVSGGNIHNIAMGAAFLAADAGQPVLMEHLLAAARAEFAKLETPLNDAEVAGWI
jgi:hypothetical protein